MVDYLICQWKANFFLRNINLIFDVTMSKTNFFSIWKMKWCFMKVFCLFEKKNLYIRFALVWTQSNICCGQHFVVKLLFAANGIAMQKGHVKERKGRFGCFFVFIKMKKNDIRKVLSFVAQKAKRQSLWSLLLHSVY